MMGLMSDSKPCIHGVDSSMLPAIRDWKVGDKYVLEVTVTLKELEQDQNDKKAFRSEFSIEKIKSVGKKSDMEKLEEKYS